MLYDFTYRKHLELSNSYKQTGEWLCQGLGRWGNTESLFDGSSVSDLQDEEVLEIGCTTIWIHLKTTEMQT